MSYRILMISSIPFASPWNGADKNLGRLIAETDNENKYILQTGPQDGWPAHVTPVRSPHPGAMPTASQKLSAFEFLIRHARQADLVHIVASLSHPSRISITLLKAWRKAAHTPILHTLPSLGDRLFSPNKLIGDVNVVVSEDTLSKLQKHGVGNAVRVFPPLDERWLQPKTSPEKVNQELALGPRAVLYPAHYGSLSGIAEMIWAFSRLPTGLEDAVLALACRTKTGQDPQAEASKVMATAEEAGIANRVRIIGNFQDMPALIAACKITALVPQKLSSKMDLPLVVLESLGLQRPVIVTDQPPINEALFGVGGIPVPFGDTAALSSAISRLLADEDVYRQVAAAGYTAVRQNCAPEKVVEQYRNIYQATLATSESAPSKKALSDNE